MRQALLILALLWSLVMPGLAIAAPDCSRQSARECAVGCGCPSDACPCVSSSDEPDPAPPKAPVRETSGTLAIPADLPRALTFAPRAPPCFCLSDPTLPRFPGTSFQAAFCIWTT